MNLQLAFGPTIARLRAEAPMLKTAGGAVEYERALQNAPALPAAFVIPGRETATDNEFGNQIVEQRVDVDFAVVLAVRNVSDASGAAALESLKPVRDAVCVALLNWQPDAEFYGCEYGGGELFAWKDGVIWWAETYRTSHLIRSE